jgi:hypothetical protein
MSDEQSKEYLRLTPYDRTDGVTTVSVEIKDNLSTMDLKLGTKIEMTVVGIERRGWEGVQVR